MCYLNEAGGIWGEETDFLTSQRVTGSIKCLLNQTMSCQGKEPDVNQSSLIESWLLLKDNFQKGSNYGSHTDIE